MSVPARFILSQSVGIRALGETAFRGALSRLKRPGQPTVPGPEYKATLAPPSRQLVDAYLRHLGSDPALYADTLPPHLFPQWSFLLMSRSLGNIPYPILRVVNAGCRLEINRPLPAGESLDVTAQLVSIDADERKALMTQRIVTGTKSAPEAIVAHLTTFVPLGGKRKGGSDSQRTVVPQDATEIESWDLPANAGFEYAKLAGDFNPIHWIPPYARAMGFKNPILHGFANMARAIETLNRKRFDGNPRLLRSCEARFFKPLVLPAKVGVYVKDHALYTASAPGQPPFLEGSFTTVTG